MELASVIESGEWHRLGSVCSEPRSLVPVVAHRTSPWKLVEKQVALNPYLRSRSREVQDLENYSEDAQPGALATSRGEEGGRLE